MTSCVGSFLNFLVYKLQETRRASKVGGNVAPTTDVSLTTCAATVKTTVEMIPMNWRRIARRVTRREIISAPISGVFRSVGCVILRMTAVIPVTRILPCVVCNYAPNFEKVGDILVSACPCVCMYSCSRYRLETSCMDSSWKNSRRIFPFFPELSPLVKLRPFDKQGDEIL